VAKPAPFQLQVVLSEPSADSDTLTNVGINAEPLYVQKTPVLDHTAISSAVVKTDASTGTAQIDVEFNDLGRDLFAAVTKENINKRLAIVLDGQLYAAPMIRSEITDGKASVTGSFTPDEANALAAKINQAVATQ
jgi:preprotein translocase subunit SecD